MWYIPIRPIPADKGAQRRGRHDGNKRGGEGTREGFSEITQIKILNTPLQCISDDAIIVDHKHFIHSFIHS